MDTLRQRIQKAIPTVYDESLSYYEVLQKVIIAMNELTTEMDGITANIDRVCEEVLNQYLANGELGIDAVYNETDESLSFVFSKEGI